MSHEVVAYRVTGFDTPLWGFPNTSPGRWNRPNSWPAQYVALHPMGPWAELLRNLGARGATEADAVRAPLWAIRVTLAEAPLAIGFAEAGDHGLDPADLVADDWTACQAAAARLHADGVRSIRVPSAALAGTENLVVLQPAVVTGYQREPVDWVDQPAAIAARDACSPEHLWARVRHRGDPHAALDAHRAGREFAFAQP